MADYGPRPEVQQHPSSLETARFPSGSFLLSPVARWNAARGICMGRPHWPFVESRRRERSGACRVGVPTLTHRAVQMADYVSRPEVQQHPSSLETARFPSGSFLLSGAPHGGAGRGASAERRPVGADRCRSAPVVLGGAWQASAIAAQAGTVRGGDPMRKQRLDTLLAERGLFSSRSRAAASVMAGEVCVGPERRRAQKPGEQVAVDAPSASPSARGSSRAAGSSSRTPWRGPASRSRAAARSTSAPRREGSRTACCSTAPPESSRSTSATASSRTRCAPIRACGRAGAHQRAQP